MNKKINCKWLNTQFGNEYWICNGLLKKIDKEICEKCEHNSEEKCDEYDKTTE